MKVALRTMRRRPSEGGGKPAPGLPARRIHLTMKNPPKNVKGSVYFGLAVAALIAAGIGPGVAGAAEGEAKKNGPAEQPAPGPTYLQDVRPIIMGNARGATTSGPTCRTGWITRPRSTIGRRSNAGSGTVGTGSSINSRCRPGTVRSTCRSPRRSGR